MIKKMVALMLVLAMTLAMGMTALAADNDGDTATDGIAGNTNGKWTAQDQPVVQTDKTAILYKELTVYNPATCKVNEPTITYTYTVTAGASGKEIYDAETNHKTGASAHVYTKAGIVDGISVNGSGSATGTLEWAPDNTNQIDASADGEKITKEITINFSEVAFTGAGVYRYVVTETAATYNTSGVVEGNTGHTRYLDVYVKDGSTPSSYEIYGFVCFVENNNIDGRKDATANTPAAAIKTEGFVARTGETEEDTKTADEYYTYNLTIEKTLENDQQMNSHKFPFSVDFVNTTVTANVLPIVSGEGVRTAPTLTAGDINGMDQDGTNLAIANGGSVTFTGIPVGTTVTINEKNDVNGTVYTTKTEDGTTNQSTGLSVPWDTWTNAVTGWTTVTALQKTANDNTVKADANMTVKFTNTLLTISPTGVVLRIAPYIMILAAGIILLLVSRRRKAVQD